MRRVPRTGGHRPAPPQRQLLRRPLPQVLSRPGGPGDRRARHDRAGGPRPGGRLGREGQPRAVGPPARARLRRRGHDHRARHRRLQHRQHRGRTRVRRAPRAHVAPHRPPRRLRLRHPHGVCGHQTGAVLVVRTVQAPPDRQGGPRRWLRRRGHRAQPRRRGRSPLRQRAPLAHRVPGPPAAHARRADAGPTAAARGPERASSRARSSRWSGSPNERRRPIACCAASTTSSRSARWPTAIATSATRRRSTPSRPHRPAPSRPSTSGSWPGPPPASRRSRRRRRGAPGLRPLRIPDHR